jgi:creatinine amidohydrolase
MPGLRLAWYDWWLANSVLAVAEKHQIKPSHANWLEAFPFTIVGELPDEEKVPPRVPGIMDAEEASRVYGDGSFGGRYQVEGNIMQEIFEAALLDILQLLKFE